MLAHAKRSPELFAPKITIERPIALTGPSKGKFESLKTTRLSPKSVKD